MAEKELDLALAGKRLWLKVSKTDSCWNWTGSTKEDGYARIMVLGKLVYVHRLSWILAHGHIQNGLMVLHSCDNRRCVNPKHLFLGNSEVNMRDASSKGRLGPYNKHKHQTTHRHIGDGRLRGNEHQNSKITNEEAAQLRSMYQTGNYTLSFLAKQFGLSVTQARRVGLGKSRKDKSE